MGRRGRERVEGREGEGPGERKCQSGSQGSSEGRAVVMCINALYMCMSVVFVVFVVVCEVSRWCAVV